MDKSQTLPRNIHSANPKRTTSLSTVSVDGTRVPIIASSKETLTQQLLWQMLQAFPSFITMKAQARAKIDMCAEELNSISQEIWKNPELRFQEHKAHNLLTDYLERQGFKVERNYILPTAFKASFGNDGGRNIAVLCEYDALPDIGHACGHNLIAEVGIGAALGIKAAIEAMDSSSQKGKITVLGTPAEEGGGGKIDLIENGAFYGIDVAMMAHPFNDDTGVCSFFARQKLRIKYFGQAAHAALSPWCGKNALDAAVLCYTSISNMRQQLKPTTRVHGIFSNGGAQPNIIPEVAELLYYLRSPTTENLQEVISKVEACAKGAAVSSECRVEIKHEGYYAEMVTNRILCSLYEKHATDMGVKFETDLNILKAVGGSTDMGNVSFVVPSIHPMFNINTLAPNHSREFTAAAGAKEAQKPTLIQAKALALTAIDLLQPGGAKILENINHEFTIVRSRAPKKITAKINPDNSVKTSDVSSER